MQVQLTGTPVEKGWYTVTGCTVQLHKVTWHQPWSSPPATLAGAFKPKPPLGEAGGTAEVLSLLFPKALLSI